MKKYDLSNAFIEAIDLPTLKEKKKAFGCQFESGLNLMVSWKSGANVSKADASANRRQFFKFIWRLRYVKTNGVRSSIDIGYWPAISQDAAIEASKNVKSGVTMGRDFIAERKMEQEQVIPRSIVRDSSTIAHLLNKFIEWRGSRYPGKSSTNDYYQKQINNHLLPRWGMFPVEGITKWGWQEYIREIKVLSSDNVARHVHSTMRAALTYAVKSSDFPSVTVNLLLGLDVASEFEHVVRDRFFSNDELHVFMNELYGRQAPLTQKNIVMLQLYQGLRISEIVNIRIDQLSTLSKSEIGIVVKGGKVGYTMLSTQAIELIKRQMRHLIDDEVKSDWLFPADYDHSDNYTTREAGDFIKKIRGGWLSFSSHDLRRTCRTWLGEFTCPKEMRDKICNHAVPKGKDASYDHSKRKDEQLRWMQLWADKLDLIKSDRHAFAMESDTSIDAESANELDDLMNQLL